MGRGRGEVDVSGLEVLAGVFFKVLGPKPRREVLEQWMCFLAAVWNGMVIYAQLGEYEPIRDVMRKIEGLADPERTNTSELFLEVVEKWLKSYRAASWLYRHVHVVLREDGQLRVRAECVALGQWLSDGTSLRMGLPD